jgi:hypothetical protein
VHLAPWVQGQAVGLGHLDDAVGQGLPVHRRIEAEGHVLEHRHRLEEREVLEDHADAEVPCGVRRGDGDRAALPVDLALVGGEDAVDDLDQGRLAGTVLAQKRVDLALLDGERHVVIGQHAGVGLADAGEGEAGGGHQATLLRDSPLARASMTTSNWAATEAAMIAGSLPRIAGRPIGQTRRVRRSAGMPAAMS